MIKGVNKRIIEVLHPEEECFEKIILFLNPNCSTDAELLSRKTNEYLRRVSGHVKKKRKKQPFRFWKESLCVLGGAVFSILIVSLF